TALRDWATQVGSKYSTGVAEGCFAKSRFKKKVIWQTTLGRVVVTEQVLRAGRRGIRYRPFCQALGVRHRGYSKGLQRALTDFGAEEAFERAAMRIQEHYGIKVCSTAIRRITLGHGRAIVRTSEQVQWPGVGAIVTQMDGSLIPVVQPDTEAADA